MSSRHKVVEVLDASEAVLLDFDGPVCDLFAGFPAPDVADAMRSALSAWGVGDTRLGFDSTDPLVVMRAGAAHIGSEAAHDVLARFEMQAARDAALTPGASECLHAFAAARKPVIIVSSNDSEAVQSFLVDKGLRDLVVGVVGRPSDDLDTMKPHPRTLLEACDAVGVASAHAVMIGDSVSDIDAARAAGCASIGYANKPGKERTLASATVVVNDMHEIASATR